MIDTNDGLYEEILLSDETDCVRHAIREIASRFNISGSMAAAYVATMHGLHVTNDSQADLVELAAELGIELDPAKHSRKV